MESFRAAVAPADCDHLGHMNVQHYFRAVSDGMFAVMLRIGLTPEEIRLRKLSFAVVRAETEFHRELHAGDVIALESTILRVGGKSAVFHHRLTNVATEGVAMSTEFSCVLLEREGEPTFVDNPRWEARAVRFRRCQRCRRLTPR
jgi:acyl-CoA thioester hydrolase